MIELNTKIETKVEVDMGVKGTTSTPRLRMLFYTPTFFIGFDGDHRLINIPILSDISWPKTEVVHAKLEVILDEYNLVLWEDDIRLIEADIKPENISEDSISINKIKIKVNFEEPNEDEKLTLKVTPKF